MNFNLPKGYLSSSSVDLWWSSKDQFRNRYYENAPSIETAETIFGKHVHKIYEENPDIPGSETRLECELVPGLTIMGYIDSLDPETLSIIDFKTGHRNKKGDPPWNRVKVQKHNQLVFYCLLVNKCFGRYNRKVTLKWIETRWKENTIVFDGIELSTDSRDLELTGYEKDFHRTIYKYELDNLEQKIIKAAHEISEDYAQYKERNHK